jgi:hypothetical protein
VNDDTLSGTGAPFVIIHCEASEVEVAALLAVLAARSAPAAEPPALRRRLSAWVASGLTKGTRTSA